MTTDEIKKQLGWTDTCMTLASNDGYTIRWLIRDGATPEQIKDVWWSFVEQAFADQDALAMVPQTTPLFLGTSEG